MENWFLLCYVDDHSVGLDPELCEVDLDLFFSFVEKERNTKKQAI